MFQRGGTIIPTLQRVRRSTKIMMNDPYTLIVALDENGKAKGHLYMDDGQSFMVIYVILKHLFSFLMLNLIPDYSLISSNNQL